MLRAGTSTLLIVSSLVVLVGPSLRSADAPRASARQAPPHSTPSFPQRAFIDAHCVACHNDRARTAGLTLSGIDLTDVAGHAELWEKVLHKLRMAIDLLAMRPPRPDLQKILKEYAPPITPLRYLIYDAVVVLSGVTAVLPTLEEQMADILLRIEGSLKDAGCSWSRVAQTSFLLHRSQNFETLEAIFKTHINANIPQMEYFHVDGYSSAGKLIEIEVTATT